LQLVNRRLAVPIAWTKADGKTVAASAGPPFTVVAGFRVSGIVIWADLGWATTFPRRRFGTQPEDEGTSPALILVPGLVLSDNRTVEVNDKWQQAHA